MLGTETESVHIDGSSSSWGIEATKGTVAERCGLEKISGSDLSRADV